SRRETSASGSRPDRVTLRRHSGTLAYASVLSPGPPFRRALLEECAQTLLAFVACAALGDPPRRLGPVGPLADESLRPTRGLGPGRQQLADDAVDSRAEIVNDLVHQADAQSGLCVEALAGDEVAARRAGPDLRQRERRDHGRDDPELHLREREQRVATRDP